MLEPKCICHGAIGTLIQHKKEHSILSDMKPGDVFFQFTTVTWMMYLPLTIPACAALTKVFQVALACLQFSKWGNYSFV